VKQRLLVHQLQVRMKQRLMQKVLVEKLEA
jgi:hypothetical protein